MDYKTHSRDIMFIIELFSLLKCLFESRKCMLLFLP